MVGIKTEKVTAGCHSTNHGQSHHFFLPSSLGKVRSSLDVPSAKKVTRFCYHTSSLFLAIHTPLPGYLTIVHNSDYDLKLHIYQSKAM